MKQEKQEKIVISRYESKYLIPESLAAEIREYIRPVCSPDSNIGPDGRYTVNNLYFDTPEMRFYYDTKYKRFNRFKPRVRYYGEKPDGFLWLELKHKVQTVTWKTRQRLPVEEWETLFDGGNAEHEGCRRITIQDSFEEAVNRYGASPIVHVRYIREPYVSDLENYCRITFDRRLSFRLARGSYNLMAGDEFLFYDDAVSADYPEDESPIILEIKTETNIPVWVIRLIQRFDLQRRGFSKYCNALDRCMAETGTPGRICAMM